MNDEKKAEKSDAWIISLNNMPFAIHDTSVDFAWLAAERIAGMKRTQLEAFGYEARRVKLTFLDED